jgi:mRNA interferase RelE/StbE
MTWTIRLSDRAHQDLSRLDHQLVRRIYRFLFGRLAKLEDPRSVGDALRGSKFGEYWKYRVGDYRLICKIEDDRLLVLVLRIGHRREIYR